MDSPRHHHGTPCPADAPPSNAATLAHAGAREVRPHRWGMNTLLGRYLYSACGLVIVLIAVAWMANAKVNQAAHMNTNNLSERQNTSRELRDLSNELWVAANLLQGYMIVPNESARVAVRGSLKAIENQAQRFAHHAWVQNQTSIRGQAEDIMAQVTRLNQELEKLMEIRADPLKVFPSMPIMVERLNPIHAELIAAATLAMDEAAEQPDDPQQRAIHKLFAEVRYNWAQRINVFRLFISSRMGVFNVSMESVIKNNKINMAFYAEKIQANLATLSDLDERAALDLQQSHSLATISRLLRDWEKAYQELLVIYLSDRWRTDTLYLSDVVQPQFMRIWERLRAIEKEVEALSAQDISVTTVVADQVTNSLWLIAFLGLLVAGVGTGVFEFQIRRPLARIAVALKAEATGQVETALPVAGTAETRLLVEAFQNMRRQVHTRQERLEAVLAYAAEAIVTSDEHGVIESFNPAAEKIFGYSADEVIGKNLRVLMPEPAHGEHYIIGSEREVMGQRKDGASIPLALNVSEMRVDGRRLFLGMIRDVSERRAMLEQLKAREQRLQSILDNTAEGIISFDQRGMIESFNKAAESLFGWAENEMLGTSIADLIAPEARANRANYAEHFMRAEIQRLVGHEGEVVGRHKNGATFPMSIKITSMMHAGILRYTALAANIVERKRLMEDLQRMAEHDGLTGLYNRSYFLAELERVVERTRRSEQATCALLYIDLDQFKYINDTLGHAAGDRLLVEVAKILGRRARKSDVIARLGGDEFTILAYDATPDLVGRIAESFRQQLADHVFHYEGKAVGIGCSIGAAVVTPAMLSAAEAMSRADLACHLAKRAGRNRVHVFSPEDEKDIDTMTLDMGWAQRIKEAIEKNRFVLALQPVVNTRTREVAGYEVLIRLREDNGEFILPGGFLPTAERFGLATDIDRWVIDHAIVALAAARASDPCLHYAINLSAQTLTSLGIAEFITEKIRAHGVDPTALTFEITETAAIADLGTAIKFLSGLQALGCKTALDDFGSGMSSFAYLKDLPVDLVKIDGKFIKNLTQDPVDQAMVKAMNDIAHALGKETIAEFVENEESFQFLADIGVDYAQGFHLGRPALMDDASVPPADVAETRKKGMSS